FLDRPEQAQRLSQEAKKILAELATGTARYPQGIDTAPMKVFPIRSQYLPKLKKDFASFPWPDDEKLKPLTQLLSETRLDDVYYHADSLDLIFTGVCINGDIDDYGKKSRQARFEEAVALFLEKRYAVS